MKGLDGAGPAISLIHCVRLKMERRLNLNKMPLSILGHSWTQLIVILATRIQNLLFFRPPKNPACMHPGRARRRNGVKKLECIRAPPNLKLGVCCLSVLACMSRGDSMLWYFSGHCTVGLFGPSGGRRCQQDGIVLDFLITSGFLRRLCCRFPATQIFQTFVFSTLIFSYAISSTPHTCQ